MRRSDLISNGNFYYTKLVVFIAMTMLALGISANGHTESLTATVDRTAIGVNETLGLVVKYEGERVNGDPDFSALSQHFDVLNNQKSMQHSVINGQVSASTEWRLTLAAKDTGQILIPPFSLQGQRSRPITITVSEAAIDTGSGREDVFLETSVSQKEGYVQEQFIVTFALYYNRNVDSLDKPDFQVNNAKVEELPRVDYQKTVGNSAYGVSEFKYAFFPDVSGAISIPSQLWTVRTTDQATMSRFGLGGGRYKLHRAKTEAIELQVLPKPASFPANQYWLPAQNVSLEQEWSRNVSEFKIGEPITRTVTITAVGVSGEQLPTLFNDATNPDFKFYPDKPKQESSLTAQGVIAKRVESVAIVPSHGGTLTLPELAVTWWNSKTQSVEKATLPAITVTIAESAGTPSPQAAAPMIINTPADLANQTENTVPSNGSNPLWQWISLFLLMGNATFAWLWFSARYPRRKPAESASQQNQSANLETVALACKQQSPSEVQKALLLWSAHHWPNSPPSFKTIKNRTQNSVIAKQLDAIEQTLYSEQTISVDYSVLINELKAFIGKKAHNSNSSALPELYLS